MIVYKLQNIAAYKLYYLQIPCFMIEYNKLVLFNIQINMVVNDLKNNTTTDCVNHKTGRFNMVLRHMFINYFEHNVAQNAASLAYNLLFALFPFLIFVSNLLGILNLNIYAVTNAIGQVMPSDVVGIIESYLEYVSGNSNHLLLWFALIFSIWFPMRAAKGIMNDVRQAYGLGNPPNIYLYTFRQLIYTVVLLIVVVLTLLLSFVGERFLSYLNSLIPEKNMRVSEYLLGTWQYLRFIPVAFLMSVAIGTLYVVSLDKMEKIRAVLPGIMFALVLWMIVSIVFSFYVEKYANYTIIYGTLGAMMILMIWLYLSAIILILGAELNAAIKLVLSKPTVSVEVDKITEKEVCEEKTNG